MRLRQTSRGLCEWRMSIVASSAWLVSVFAEATPGGGTRGAASALNGLQITTVARQPDGEYLVLWPAARCERHGGGGGQQGAGAEAGGRPPGFRQRKGEPGKLSPAGPIASFR